eukprot:gene11384-21581_t
MFDTKVKAPHKDDRDLWVNLAVFAYNTSRHDSIGFSPYDLVFWRVARTPVEVDLEGEPTYPVKELPGIEFLPGSVENNTENVGEPEENRDLQLFRRPAHLSLMAMQNGGLLSDQQV